MVGKEAKEERVELSDHLKGLDNLVGEEVVIFNGSEYHLVESLRLHHPCKG